MDTGRAELTAAFYSTRKIDFQPVCEITLVLFLFLYDLLGCVFNYQAAEELV